MTAVSSNNHETSRPGGASEYLMDSSEEWPSPDAAESRNESLMGRGLLSLAWDRREEQDKSDAEKAWDALRHHYRAYAILDNPLSVTEESYDDYILGMLRWRASGIETERDKFGDDRQPTSESLVRSIETGTIRTLFNNDETLYIGLIDDLVTKGINVKPSTDMSAHERALDAVVEPVWQLAEIAKEAKENEYKGRYISGPYRDLYNEITEQAAEVLVGIHPELTLNSLHGTKYQTRATKTVLNELDQEQRDRYFDVRGWRDMQMRDVADQTLRKHWPQSIPLGLLSCPPHSRQLNTTACANAVFRMVYNHISGEEIDEVNLRGITYKYHKNDLIEDVDYLKLFETESFEKRYDARVQSLQFMGMNFEKIHSITKWILNRYDDAEVYVISNIESTVGKYIQHRVILLGADNQGGGQQVVVNDPSQREGSTYYHKAEFCERWAMTANSGSIIVSRKKKS